MTNILFQNALLKKKTKCAPYLVYETSRSISFSLSKIEREIYF